MALPVIHQLLGQLLKFSPLVIVLDPLNARETKYKGRCTVRRFDRDFDATKNISIQLK
jgi:hypothetical protein